MAKNKKMKKDLLDELQSKTNDLRFFKEAILRRYGWEQSCDFPDCCWRWVKEIKGVTIAVSLGDALQIEARL